MPKRRKPLRLPGRLRIGRRGIDTAAAALWFAAAATLAAELATGQHWYHLIGRTIYNPFALTEPDEMALFAATLISAHLALFGLCFAAAARVSRRRWGGASLGFHVLAAAFALWGGLLLVRDMAQGFAADVPDLEQLVGLAGGHLWRGLVYVGPQMVLLGVGALALLAVYVLLRTAIAFDLAPRARVSKRARLLVRVVGGIVTIALLFVSARVPPVRDALIRFAAPRLAFRLLDAATDFDGDGSGLFASPPDDAPFDATRHPYALDVPGDGIDQDGLAGDFHYHAPPAAPAGPLRFPGARRHVLLIVLESTRADAIGKIWAGSVVAPNLNALAAAGSASAEAYSNRADTGDSMKVVFTGALAPDTADGTVFTDFRGAGYRVAAFSGSPEDWGDTATELGVRQSTDVFVDAATLRKPGAPAAAVPVADPADVLRAFDRALGDRARWARPNFIYFNIRFPHFPYEQVGTRQLLPGRPIAQREIGIAHRTAVEGAYWNAVANADRMVGALLARLRTLGVAGETAVVVIGDHGEELFEDGHLGHGLMLDPRTTRVPFIVSLPHFPLPRPVGLANLRAILLRAAGADVPLPASQPVFSFLGSLDRPFLIGMAEAGGAMTTLSLRDGHVIATAPPGAGRYPELAPRGALKAKADALAVLWEQARWEHYLKARRAPFRR